MSEDVFFFLNMHDYNSKFPVSQAQVTLLLFQIISHTYYMFFPCHGDKSGRSWKTKQNKNIN